MRVKLLVGPDQGNEVDVSDDEAVRMISARFAIPAPPRIERTVIKPVETRKRKK